MAIAGPPRPGLASNSWSDTPFFGVCRVTGSGRDENIQVYNVVSDIYEPHQHGELLDGIHLILDDDDVDLQIGSAGLLRQGAVSWVQLRTPEFIEVEGDEFLPFILATTSHDSSIATTFRACYQRVVCDNTLAMAVGEKRSVYKFKHTKGNVMDPAEARDQIGILFDGMDEFNTKIQALMQAEITQVDFTQAIEIEYGSRPEPSVEDGKVRNQRAINNWERRWDELVEMYTIDPRAAEYRGTAWGAVQAHDTWTQWGMSERDTNDRTVTDDKERQLDRTVAGTLGTDHFLQSLELAYEARTDEKLLVAQ